MFRRIAIAVSLLLMLGGCSEDSIRAEFDDPDVEKAGDHKELVNLIVHDYEGCIYHLDSLMLREDDSLLQRVKVLHQKNLNRFIAYGRQMEKLETDLRDSCRAAMMQRLYQNIELPMLRIRSSCDSLRSKDPLSELVRICDELIMIGMYADFESLRRLRPEIYDSLKG